MRPLLVCPQCQNTVWTLYHVDGIPGDYCSSCKPPAPPPRPNIFTEDVRGHVVGDMLTNYQFWTSDGKNCIAKTAQPDDETAITWFRTNYPDAYAAGATMRIYED